MTSRNPVADMIVELMGKMNARNMPVERSPALGQYLRESYGFDLPSERRPGGREMPNVREFPEQNLGTGGVSFDAEGWPTGSGGWAQREEARTSADRGEVNAGLAELALRAGVGKGGKMENIDAALAAIPDDELREFGAKSGYSGIEDPKMLRTILAIRLRDLGKF